MSMRFCILLFIILSRFSSLSAAAEGGYSNYIPGFYGDIALAVEPADGLSMRNDVYFYNADGGGSVRTGLIELEVDVDLTFDYLTLLYKPGVEVFGAQYAFGTVLVYGKVDLSGELDVGPFSESFSEDKTSYGDMTLIPGVFYWNNGDKWHFSQSFFVVVPVGDYDEDDAANTGLNYWTFETDFAATYFDQETGRTIRWCSVTGITPKMKIPIIKAAMSSISIIFSTSSCQSRWQSASMAFTSSNSAATAVTVRSSATSRRKPRVSDRR